MMTPTALIVEDNALNLRLFREVLGAGGFRVVALPDGRDALHVAEREGADVVLMDLQLPYVSGIEVTRRLRAHAPTAGIPVVAISAYTAEEDERRALAAGAVAFLAKPVNNARLVGVLKGAVAMARANVA